MGGNVVGFGGETKNDIHPDKVLDAAIGKVARVILIGTCDDGQTYYASSYGDKAELLWAVEEFKRSLFEEY